MFFQVPLCFIQIIESTFLDEVRLYCCFGLNAPVAFQIYVGVSVEVISVEKIENRRPLC